MIMLTCIRNTLEMTKEHTLVMFCKYLNYSKCNFTCTTQHWTSTWVMLHIISINDLKLLNKPVFITKYTTLKLFPLELGWLMSQYTIKGEWSIRICVGVFLVAPPLIFLIKNIWYAYSQKQVLSISDETNWMCAYLFDCAKYAWELEFSVKVRMRC